MKCQVQWMIIYPFEALINRQNYFLLLRYVSNNFTSNFEQTGLWRTFFPTPLVWTYKHWAFEISFTRECTCCKQKMTYSGECDMQWAFQIFCFLDWKFTDPDIERKNTFSISMHCFHFYVQFVPFYFIALFNQTLHLKPPLTLCPSESNVHSRVQFWKTNSNEINGRHIMLSFFCIPTMKTWT